ncbi:polysaccharide biosynthesis C-terminal domain-containing protein [Tellurirhabdus rosea]|uniref:polysaccharide biosynthesis C-terminal domain-containing protein n=1 Tax=Tellurirhabdus rosea TaxID=2674997 RepID=UPI00225798CC|nr:polysaccharide biosynthesis C-terminal domain-containing protein [Tellurirhabdus rosea]
MGIIIRQSLKASLGSYIGVGIGIVNQLLVSPELLSADQLAISRLLLENSLVFAAFAHLGTPFIGDRFFGYFRNDQNRHDGFLGFLLSFPLIGIALFTAAYFLFEGQIQNYFAEQSPQLIQYHALVVPLTVFWIYIVVLESYCRNNARIAIPTFIREVYLKLTNVLLVLLFGFGWYNFDWLIYLIVASYGSAVLVLLVYIAQLGRFSLRFDFNRLKGGLFRQMTYYGLFIVMGGVGINLVMLIDRTMLSHGEGLTETAIFIIATYIAGIIEIPRKAITQISTPLLANSIREDNRPHVLELYQKSSLNQLIVGGLAFLLVWTNIDGILSILPKADLYSQGKWVVLLISLSKLFDMALGLNGEMITYSKHYRYVTFLVIAMAGVAIGANAYFIPLFGYNGAAIATALTTLLYALSKSALVWRFFRMVPFTTSVLKAILALALVYAVSFLLPEWRGGQLQTLLSIAFRSAVLTGLFAGLILALRVSEDINHVATAARKTFLN